MKIKQITFSFMKVLIFSYILTGIFLSLLAFVLYQTDASTKIANLGVTLIYIIVCLISGLIIGKRMEKKKFLWGMLLGLIYFLCLLIISLLIHQDQQFLTTNRITAMFLCIASATLGGMVS